jgi:hypothetical protein
VGDGIPGVFKQVVSQIYIHNNPGGFAVLPVLLSVRCHTSFRPLVNLLPAIKPYAGFFMKIGESVLYKLVVAQA